MSVICIKCSAGQDTVEFDSVKELVAHEKAGHVSRPKRGLPPSPPTTPSATELKALGKVPKGVTAQVLEREEKPVQKPLELQYRWLGIHSVCNTEVKTIAVDIGEKQTVIAYCVPCDLKLGQQTVLPIPKIGT